MWAKGERGKRKSEPDDDNGAELLGSSNISLHLAKHRFQFFLPSASPLSLSLFSPSRLPCLFFFSPRRFPFPLALPVRHTNHIWLNQCRKKTKKKKKKERQKRKTQQFLQQWRNKFDQVVAGCEGGGEEEKKKKPFQNTKLLHFRGAQNIRAAATLVPVTGVKAELSGWCGHSSGLMSSLMSSLLGRSLICSSAGWNYRTAAAVEVPLVVWGG